jgi:hypothetical protein
MRSRKIAQPCAAAALIENIRVKDGDLLKIRQAG